MADSYLQFVLRNIEPVVKCLGKFCPHLFSWGESEKQKFKHDIALTLTAVETKCFVRNKIKVKYKFHRDFENQLL